MMHSPFDLRRSTALIALACALAAAAPALAQHHTAKPAPGPWMNTNLSADQRAALVLKEMTLDEKIALLHGVGMPTDDPVTPENAPSNRGVGYAVGVPRLGIPGIDMSDAAYGVRSSGVNGRYSTALPANVAAASSWDVNAAYEYGALIGRELRAQGFNMSLGGGVNLTRDPRNGRTFEYLGEDPVLAGTLVAHLIQGTQSANVIGDIKHYALNDQESGRNSVNIHISERAARESDLLAFEIGVLEGKPAAVMCSYNRVNGDFACENKWLLTDVLKKDWNFPGFVLSDWGGTHSVEKASAAGLDNEQPGFHPQSLDAGWFFLLLVTGVNRDVAAGGNGVVSADVSPSHVVDSRDANSRPGSHKAHRRGARELRNLVVVLRFYRDVAACTNVGRRGRAARVVDDGGRNSIGT